MNAFTLFYAATALLLWIVAVPLLALASLLPKYRHSIPARFFLWRNPPFREENAVWYHACSVGEVASLAPLIEATKGTVELSVITQTGMRRARAYDKEVRYLPYEFWLPFWTRRPRVLVVVEAELWYLLFWSAKRRGAKTLLLNARISDRSWPRYRRFGWFYRRIFALIDTVFAQSEEDAARLRALGARRVEVAGNIKAATRIEPRQSLSKPAGTLLIFASTHKGEEETLLRYLVLAPDERLAVVPRHPERFGEVERLLRTYARGHGYSFARWSEDASLDAQVVLIDRMGMLIDLYAIGDIVFLGGSFVEGVGGHNPLEPARFGCKILSGPYYFNQKPLYRMVSQITIVPKERMEWLREEIARTQPASILERVDIQAIMKEINSVV